MTKPIVQRAIRGRDHVGDLSTPNMRLAKARIDAGYRSATQAADELGVSATTLQQHENGTRPLSRDAAAFYETRLKIPSGYLLYGRLVATSAQSRVPLIGTVERAGTVVLMAHSEIEEPPTVESPAHDTEGLQAVEVLSDDLFPAFRRGDIVFFNREPSPSNDLDGRECIVTREDGMMQLRILHSAGPEQWILSSYQASIAPERGRIRSAHPILWVRRGPISPS